MRVNTGGDPGRDDYGLPPVDIEVPDDARELDRDMQAYHRELRSRRRRRLARRLYGPLTSDGMVLPLLAGCLALTLLAATLLTVFTVGQGTIGGPFVHPSAGTSTSPRPSLPGAALVNDMVAAGGRLEPVSNLAGNVLVLALIPPGCGSRCFHDLRQLIEQASQGGGMPYLVGIRNASVSSLPRRLGLGAGQALEDSEGMISARYPGARLTAVVVRPDGSAIREVPDQGHGFPQIAEVIRQLVPAANRPAYSPAGSQPTATATSSPAG
jgi:hypothetical protein